MKRVFNLRVRSWALVVGALLLVTIAAWPFASGQQPATPWPAPFDEVQIVTELNSALQLSGEQANALSGLLKRRRPRMDGLWQQMVQLSAGSPQFAELRSQFERERRATFEEFLPSLRPEQQARLRQWIGNASVTMPSGSASKPAVSPVRNRPAGPVSAIQPLKPVLPAGVLSAGERLISLPAVAADDNARERRASSASTLSEEQRILHLLNRAGFGPRPGDIERVRKMGIERYLEEQLHPEELADDFLVRPLQSLGTLNMALPEIAQNFLPPPQRPVPTPTPVPQIKSLPQLKTEDKEGETKKADSMTAPNSSGSMAAPQSMQQPSQTQPTQPQEMQQQPAVSEKGSAQQSMQQPAAPTPTPQPARPSQVDTQRPLRELQQAKLLRAIFSERQLQEVMVDFWFNHFNVFAGKDNARLLLTAYERDVIRPHALGKFKDLLISTAQSPAMLYYLDNFLSQMEPPPQPVKEGEPPRRRPGLNENYARELLELHTMGVDGGYTQRDVQEVARCFTGWTIGQQPNAMFIFRPRVHDRGEKTVLGKRIAPGGGIEDGLRVLDLLSKHPATAKFIAHKLCQRFVADEPPPGLVDRTAQVFLQTDGDIRQVVRAIVTGPEFYSAKYYRNKIKSPLELAASAIRATGAATDAYSPLIQTVARMGEPLYLCQPPTGYSEDSSRWLSNATLLERMNFAVALVGNRINGTRVDVSRLVPSEAVRDQKRLLEHLLAALVHSDVSRETRDNLSKVLNDQRAKMSPAKYDERAERRNAEQVISGVAALILGAREFQVK